MTFLDPVINFYANTKMILGEDIYNAMCALKSLAADKRCSHFAVCLPRGGIKRDRLSSSLELVSCCCEANP